MLANLNLRRSLNLLAGLIVLGLSAPADANLIQNPNFFFTASGHSNGDNGLHATNIAANVPNWDSATGGFFVSDPQSIFDFTHEYYQVQTAGTSHFYQHITVPFTPSATLSMVGSRRNDAANANGDLFIQLYSGHVTTFASGLVTPDSVVDPAISGSLQTWSNTYDFLAGGDYTVRVGGTRFGGSLFQAGLSEVSFEFQVPEPSSLVLASLGLVGVTAMRRRRLRQEKQADQSR